MLLQLADECKQHIWQFLGVRELCRVACVARGAEQGVHTRPLWRRHAKELVEHEQERMRRETGLLGCRLQRGLASRNLVGDLAAGKRQQESASALALPPQPECIYSNLVNRDDTVDWQSWYRNMHKNLVVFQAANTGFSEAMTALQDLKTERSGIKEALQTVKTQAQADKRTRRTQMHCVRWMNRTHRRHAAASNSLQAQSAALSKSELADQLQRVESAIHSQAKELFSVRSKALKSLHRVNTQLAEGAELLRDVGGPTSHV